MNENNVKLLKRIEDVIYMWDPLYKFVSQKNSEVYTDEILNLYDLALSKTLDSNLLNEALYETFKINKEDNFYDQCVSISSEIMDFRNSLYN